jgi:hypothetical protein
LRLFWSCSQTKKAFGKPKAFFFIYFLQKNYFIIYNAKLAKRVTNNTILKANQETLVSLSMIVGIDSSSCFILVVFRIKNAQTLHKKAFYGNTTKKLPTQKNLKP